MTRVFRLNQIRRFGALLSVIAAWGMMGGHWVLPQAYAWGKMLVEYRRGTTIYKAAVDTFSGRRPCKMCLDIAVTDGFVQTAVDAITKGAKTGKIGDGKIFVLDLKDCVRISSGEKGDVAVG